MRQRLDWPNHNEPLEAKFVMAAQIRRDLCADVTSRKRPAETMRASRLASPQPDGRRMVMANSSLPPTRYWVDVILTTSWQCQRFDSESDALAYAQVYARFPNAEAVVAYAYKSEGREIIFEWSEARQSCRTERTSQ
jgi:hypothetical protein